MRIVDVEPITSEAPAQFDGKTDGDRPVYVRYRSGWLSVEVGLPGTSAEWLPGAGYVVFEGEVEAGTGSADRIDWAQVDGLVAGIDLTSTLARHEAVEADYQARWTAIVDRAERREVAGTALWTLVLEGAPWHPVFENRISRFDFEAAFEDRVGSGVCAYVHDEGDAVGATSRSITVCVSDDLIPAIKPLILAEAGAQAFGGFRVGVSGGMGRGDGVCRGSGDPEQAFQRVATALAAMKSPG